MMLFNDVNILALRIGRNSDTWTSRFATQVLTVAVPTGRIMESAIDNIVVLVTVCQRQIGPDNREIGGEAYYPPWKIVAEDEMAAFVLQPLGLDDLIHRL